MKFKSFNLIALVLLLGLAAFRPWRSVNQAVGLRNVADSVAVAGASADSMLIAQPIQVVLPASTLDSLARLVNSKDSVKTALRAKNTKLDRELAGLRKSNAEKQSSLVSEAEIANLLAKQNKHPASAESDLEKELNKHSPK